MSSMFGMIYEELEAMKKHREEDFKNFAGAFDALDREAISDIILDGETFWFEFLQFADIDDAAAEEARKYCERKGWKFLYSDK